MGGKNSTRNKDKKITGETVLPTKVKMPPSYSKVKRKSKSRDFRTLCEMRRGHAGTIVMIKDGEMMPVTEKHVDMLKKQALLNDQPSVILLRGLSRAQVGRVAGNLQAGGDAIVTVHKINDFANTVTGIKPLKYEIFIQQKGE